MGVHCPRPLAGKAAVVLGLSQLPGLVPCGSGQRGAPRLVLPGARATLPPWPECKCCWHWDSHSLCPSFSEEVLRVTTGAAPFRCPLLRPALTRQHLEPRSVPLGGSPTSPWPQSRDPWEAGVPQTWSLLGSGFPPWSPSSALGFCGLILRGQSGMCSLPVASWHLGQCTWPCCPGVAPAWSFRLEGPALGPSLCPQGIP